MTLPIYTDIPLYRRLLKPICLIIASVLLIFTLSGCNQNKIDRLKWVGKEPPLEKMHNPADKATPVRWPVMRSDNMRAKTSNSLWNAQSKTFFRDQRAHQIGDILVVKVEIKDKAELDNKTERKRKGKDSLGVPNLFGLEKRLFGMLPEKADPSKLLSADSSMDSSGEGNIAREEVIEIEVAAVVTQVLQNGNLVIYGSQEIRVNFETRQLIVEGVIRPEDLTPSNVISLNQIAEARISYGGKGLISEVQQPRIGSQIIDIISPF